MRIVLATNQLPPHELGGVGLFSVNLAAELAQMGHQVILLAGSSYGVRGRARLEQVSEVVPGVRTLRLLKSGHHDTAMGRFVSTFLDAQAEALLQTALHELAPDVLHVQHTLNLSSRLTQLGLASGAAVVATVHDFWPICQRIVLSPPEGGTCQGPEGGLRCASCLPALETAHGNLYSSFRGLLEQARHCLNVGSRTIPFMLRTQAVGGAYAQAHLLTYPAPFMIDLLKQHGLTSSRLRLVDYGTPPVPEAVVHLPRPRRPLRFGYLGTMGSSKGLLVALRAAELLHHGSWKLLVYGGPLRDRHLRQRLDPGHVGGLWEYRGAFSFADLARILTNLDAVIIPSLWPETGPLVWMEAISAGLPVIASRIGALAERVHHGEDGLLFEPGDPHALADAMARLIDDYPRLRRGALQRTVPSVRDVAQQITGIYEEARNLAR
jgi:glycosyltransferase involved in cell wall biosynthesis